MTTPHEHLEQAEHAGHHATDPFNQRVAVTMAIIAAALAGLSMLGHRKHNEVLLLQGDVNRLRIEAAAAGVEKSNNFAWYQAKRNRQAQYETAAALADALPAGPARGKPAPVEKWRKDAADYKAELEQIRKDGDAAGKKADQLAQEADRFRDAADHAHHQADRLDIAHVLAEVGLVICSLTLLTKRRGFWVSGILAAVAAVGVAGSAYLMPAHADHPTTHAPDAPAAQPAAH